ncbi:MAG: quinone-dependent dihydroorotate dehydrogenase [Nakamurella sp.]
MGYRRLARPVLFRLGRCDAETAHHRTLSALARAQRRPAALRGLARLFAADSAPRTAFGLTFPNPVGLAAGADKDGVALAAWPALGFGFVEAGTVTAIAQPGNPRPRVFRLRDSQAVINRMGFPNDGAAALAARCAALTAASGPIGVPLGISIGKSKVTPLAEATGDYLISLRAVHDHADYIAVNVSSPNTPGLRGLQDKGALDELITALMAEAAVLASAAVLGEAEALSRTTPRSITVSLRKAAARVKARIGQPGADSGHAVPILVKIAPDLDDHAIADVLQVCHDRGVAGVIATNTTVERSGIAPTERGMGLERGGLSGAPLRARALEVVRFVCKHTDLPVVGVGGISTPDDAMALLDAGAVLVQIYTGLLYQGPGLNGAITRAAALRSIGSEHDSTASSETGSLTTT